MSRKVIISKTAEKKLRSLFDYLLENWSAKVKSDFIEKLDHTIDIIRLEPETFPESQKDPGLRKCIITKQTTLYYRFDSKNIIILTIFDTRQNPIKLIKDL